MTNRAKILNLCPECQGKGYFNFPDPSQLCDECSGSGKVTFERKSNYKTTREQRIEIYKRSKNGEKMKDLSVEFGLSYGRVVQACREMERIDKRGKLEAYRDEPPRKKTYKRKTFKRSEISTFVCNEAHRIKQTNQSAEYMDGYLNALLQVEKLFGEYDE